MSTLVRVDWTPQPYDDGLARTMSARFEGADDPAWLFAGVILAEDGRSSVGVAAAVDLGPARARARMQEVLNGLAPHAAAVTTQRWRRGGR